MVNMDTDFGPTAVEPRVGEVIALRTFRVADDGALLPATQIAGTAWREGENTAQCASGVGHTAPEETCTCGFYAYGHERWIDPFSYADFHHVVGVVECYGKIVAGEKGLRTQKVRLAALWLSPQVPGALVAQVQERYPSVTIYRNKRKMLTEHPTTHLDTYLDAPSPRFRLPLWVGSRATALTLGALVGVGAGLPGVVGNAIFLAALLGACLLMLVTTFAARRGAFGAVYDMGSVVLEKVALAVPGYLIALGATHLVHHLLLPQDGSLFFMAFAGAVPIGCGAFLCWLQRGDGLVGGAPFTPAPGTSSILDAQEDGAGPMTLVREEKARLDGRADRPWIDEPPSRVMARIYRGANHGLLVTVRGEGRHWRLTPGIGVGSILRTINALEDTGTLWVENTYGVLWLNGNHTATYQPRPQDGRVWPPCRPLPVGEAYRILGLPEADALPPESINTRVRREFVESLRELLDCTEHPHTPRDPNLVALARYFCDVSDHQRQVTLAEWARAADITPGVVPEPQAAPSIDEETFAAGWAILGPILPSLGTSTCPPDDRELLTLVHHVLLGIPQGAPFRVYHIPQTP